MTTPSEAHPPTSRQARGRRSSNSVARLVHAAASGDHRAWGELVEEFEGLVWAVARAYRLSDADAADVAQITWLRLVEHLGRLQEPARVGGWLATTARRECLRVLRASRREVPTSDELPEREPDEASAIDAELLSAERDSVLWHAFERLRGRDQALLRMLVADPQPSYEEIGSALGMPIGSIGPTRARCLERFRREIEHDGIAL